MNKFSLDKDPKIKSGFKVPESYFENFSTVIMEKIAAEEPKRSKLLTLKVLSFTAAAVLMIGLCIPFLMSNSQSSLEQIDTNSLENYISYQSYGYQYEVLNLIDSQDLDDMQVELNLEDRSIEDLLTTNPNFENYILD